MGGPAAQADDTILDGDRPESRYPADVDQGVHTGANASLHLEQEVGTSGHVAGPITEPMSMIHGVGSRGGCDDRGDSQVVSLHLMHQRFAPAL